MTTALSTQIYDRCALCRYAYRPQAGGCENPACYANPRISESTKTMWRQREVAQNRESAERARIQRIQSGGR